MPTPATNTYSVQPVDGSPPYDIQAVTYEFDNTTGRHTFKDADGNLVANLLNVNVRKTS